jgi:hypothetical protein
MISFHQAIKCGFPAACECAQFVLLDGYDNDREAKSDREHGPCRALFGIVAACSTRTLARRGSAAMTRVIPRCNHLSIAALL